MKLLYINFTNIDKINYKLYIFYINKNRRRYIINNINIYMDISSVDKCPHVSGRDVSIRNDSESLGDGDCGNLTLMLFTATNIRMYRPGGEVGVYDCKCGAIDPYCCTCKPTYNMDKGTSSTTIAFLLPSDDDDDDDLDDSFDRILGEFLPKYLKFYVNQCYSWGYNIYADYDTSHVCIPVPISKFSKNKFRHVASGVYLIDCTGMRLTHKCKHSFKVVIDHGDPLV